MPATTPDGLRYPLPGDNPNVPRDIGYLAADTQAALSRLDGRGQVYHGQRGASDQFQGSATVLGFGSGAEVQPAGSQWLLHSRFVMQPNISNVNIWADPSGLTNCSVLHTDKDAAKLFVSGSAADSWSPMPWVVTVTAEGPFSGAVRVTDGGQGAMWWINRESAWLLVRVK